MVVYLLGFCRSAVTDADILCFWQDFILSTSDSKGSKIIPIEVKSGKNYSTTSIEAFKKKYKTRINQGYIIHPKNLSVKPDGTIAIPPYMTICL